MKIETGSDMDCSDIYCRGLSYPASNCSSGWKNWLWRNPRWNGGHQLLPTKGSPTISACTTSTNLSYLEFQSNSTINKSNRMNLEDNLRMAIPEIEPLQAKDSDHNINTIREDVTDLEDQEETPRLERKPVAHQLIAALAVSWVSMVIGYISGYTSPASLSLKRDLNLTEGQFSWISGFMPLFALVGGLLGGSSIDYFGRKWTILLTNVMFLIAWMANYFAQSYWHMYASRMIAGCGVGIATLTFPVYLGETVQPEVRGSLGLLPTAFGNIGIVLCYLMGLVFEWRGIAGIAVLLPLPFFLVIWFIPETPRWYLSKGKTEESRKALEWLRGEKNSEHVDKEFEELIKSQKATDESGSGLTDLFNKTNLKLMMIALGLMFFQQFSGINAVIFYSRDIFEKSGSTLDPLIQSTIIGVVNFLTTFVATVLIDRLGRKVLLYISSASMVITLAILGTYLYLLKMPESNVSEYAWIPLASILVYIVGFSLGFGPIPWLMMGEILPAKIRGPAASVATGFNWACTSVVTTAFPLISEAMGSYGVFWLFASFTSVGLIFTVLFVPETRGQSLEDIERKLAGIKVRRMSSIANLKPLQSTF